MSSATRALIDAVAALLSPAGTSPRELHERLADQPAERINAALRALVEEGRAVVNLPHSRKRLYFPATGEA